MNEHDQSTPPSLPVASLVPPAPPEPAISAPVKSLRWWLKKLFACNPFYLASAALLLFGCYRVSLDAPLLNLELARLWFNFSSVQVYEIVLVLTAAFLARRKLWYDATLLVGLENLLVFVPFILISQAAFIDSRLAVAMSVAGGVLAVVRSGVWKRILPLLPGRLLVAGFILLALNVALPLLYRHFGESKIGVHIDSGPAYEMNEGTWLLILPAVLALANFLPRLGGAGDLPSPHRWQSAGLLALWIAVTGVHVYSLDFIYQFDLRPALLAPAAWVLIWTLWLRLSEPVVWMKYARYALMVAAIFLPLLAAGPDQHHLFLILAALNILACLGVSLVEYGHRLARHLVVAAVLMFIAGLPDHWLQIVVPGLHSFTCVLAGLGAYLLGLIIFSRNPKLAVAGSFLAGWSVASYFDSPNAWHWAVQAGLVFLLLHSLRWDDGAPAGAVMVRRLAAVFWVMQSFLWMDSARSRFWMAVIPGMCVLVVYGVVQFRRAKWNLPVIPAAAILVATAGPDVSAVENISALPVGLLAVIGSFLLLGAGTVAALTRSHWHKTETMTGSIAEPMRENRVVTERSDASLSA